MRRKNILFLLLISLLVLVFSRGWFMILMGESMEPTIGRVAIAYCERGNFSVGDIIAFRYKNMTIVHRVMMIQGDTIVAKGDNNPNWMIEIVPRKDVLCKVRFFFSIVKP